MRIHHACLIGDDSFDACSEARLCPDAATPFGILQPNWNVHREAQSRPKIVLRQAEGRVRGHRRPNT